MEGKKNLFYSEIIVLLNHASSFVEISIHTNIKNFVPITNEVANNKSCAIQTEEIEQINEEDIMLLALLSLYRTPT